MQSGKIVKSIEDADRFIFKHPFAAVLAGPTMSGKSTWVKQLLENAMTMISPPPARINLAVQKVATALHTTSADCSCY